MDSSGYIDYCTVFYADGWLSPAFNINLSSVIFSSIISGTAGAAGSEYKLTIHDSNMSAAVTSGQSVSRSGDAITVPYTVSADTDRVSVLVTNGAYTLGMATPPGIKLYRALNIEGEIGTSGTGTFPLPDNYDASTDKVYILAEDLSGDDKLTDYASAPVEITIPAPTTYTVSFNGNGQTMTNAPADQTIVSGGTATEPSPAPTVAGKTLEGWYKESGCQDKWNFSTDTVTEAKTLYANWLGPTVTTTSLPGGNCGIQYSETLSATGTSGTTTWTIESGSLPAGLNLSTAGVISGTPTVAGTYNFDVKVADANGFEKKSLSIVVSSGSSGSHSITVENDGNGTGSADKQTETCEGIVNLTATPNTDYVFDCWTSNDVDINNPTSANEAWFRMADSNVTVKANFKPASPTEKCTITFDANGVEGEMDDQTVPKNTATALNGCEFTYEGHKFDGWSETADGNVKYKDKEKVTLNSNTLTLYAKWSELPPDEHTITVTDDGNGTATADKKSAAKGSPVKLTADPNENCKFKEWQVISGDINIKDDQFTMSDEDVEIKAIFEKEPTPTEKCMISFDPNGGKGEMDDQTVDKGARTQLHENEFTRDDYEFKNWNTESDGSGTSYADKANITTDTDLTLYAQWKKDEPGPKPKPKDDDDDDDDESEPAPSNENNKKVPDGCDGLRQNLSSAIATASVQGKSQTVYWSEGTSLPYDVMKMLQDNPKVTLVFSYTYQEYNYVVTIPGSAVIANPSTQWYGPVYLYTLYGGTKTPVAATNTTASIRTYTVKPKDTLTSIAKHLKTTVQYLQDVNNIKDVDKIKPGMVLKY